MDSSDIDPAGFPQTPGVYLMRDGAGRVIYIGKANNLRSRIGAYLKRADSRPMIPFLMSQVVRIECIATATEKESLILENNLIKTHRPRYNVNLRDDKDYYHLRLAGDQPFPRLELVRRPARDGAKYFGPYPSAASARETLRFLQGVFPLRTCRDRELKSRRRPCLEKAIGRCLAPCVGEVTEEAYRLLAQDVVAFLEERIPGLLAGLEERMAAAAERLEFEQAARLRDRMEAIRTTLERQAVHSLEPIDVDLFGIFQSAGLSQVCLLAVRKGIIRDKRDFPLLAVPGDEKSILGALIKQYYLGRADIPDTICLPALPEDRAIIAELLRERRGRPVVIKAPVRGRLRRLLQLARTNAGNRFAQSRAGGDPQAVLGKLADKLGLTREPRLIECYDVSNLGGAHAVGARVTFLDGQPWKQGYRRYRIKAPAGADDYGMMYEILRRRFTGGEREEPLPDLVIIDGGRGHLSVAQAVMKDLGISGIDLLALAKESASVAAPGREKIKRDEERLYLPGRKDPVYPSRWPPLLLFLQRIRDEAHRFARRYHLTVKEKSDFSSRLDLIPGIGPKRRKALLAHFHNFSALARASAEELRRVEGMGEKTAAAIRAFFETNPEGSS